MGFGIWGIDYMPIHKRKEKKRKENHPCLCTTSLLMHLASRTSSREGKKFHNMGDKTLIQHN
jgi:hypothetical protein